MGESGRKKELRIGSIKAMEDLKGYLLDHEEDIAYCINDFGDLRLLFRTVIHREAVKDIDA